MMKHHTLTLIHAALWAITALIFVAVILDLAL